jgi:hypothetical protein
MTIVVIMKGALEPQEIDMDFPSALNALNLASASGKSFAVMEDMDGHNIAFQIKNIDTIKELDD